MASDSLTDGFRAHQSLPTKFTGYYLDVPLSLEEITLFNQASHSEMRHFGLIFAQCFLLSRERSNRMLTDGDRLRMPRRRDVSLKISCLTKGDEREWLLLVLWWPKAD